MINLKLKVCIDNCSNLLIYDNTLEESSTNTTGWCNNNPNPNECITAKLEITFPDTTVQTIILNPTDLPSTVTTDFLLQNVNLVGDGEYTIKYTVTVNDVSTSPLVTYTRSTCTTIFNLCSLRCCVDKLWIKYYDNSDCCDTKYSELAVEAEALYKSILNSTGSLHSTTRDKLINKLKRLCKLAECNCK